MPDQYPGVITRRSLVDFCQQQLVRLNEHAETLEKAREFAAEKKDLDTALYFVESIASLRGEQISLRNVCEWAKDHVVQEVSV